MNSRIKGLSGEVTKLLPSPKYSQRKTEGLRRTLNSTYRLKQMKSKNNKQTEVKKVSCPFCKGKEVVKRGTFQTEAHGKQQRYFCKNCNKKFIERTGFYRMRNNNKKITCALDLFYRGVSTRKVQEHFKAFYPHNSSHKSIYKWVVKYAD